LTIDDLIDCLIIVFLHTEKKPDQMKKNRRQFLASAASLVASYDLPRPLRDNLFGMSNDAPSKRQRQTRIVLLGTKGGPRLSDAGRKNPSTLILINNVPHIVDCGYGTSRQMIAAGVSLDRLRYIFITHHHSDHNLEYGPLLYNSWITGLPIQVDAFGPPGLQQMTRDFFNYQKFDIDTRIVDEGRPDLRQLVAVYEFSHSGVVMQNEHVKVKACRVRHPPITQSYAYRFDAKDRSVVISGDTTYAPELAEFAKGADVLVHEVMYLPGLEALLKRLPNAKRLREHLMAAHTLPEDVGRIAAHAGVDTLVLTHFVPGDDASITDEQWGEGARKHFSGRIIVGKDLMEI
jgi:ribonuclease BN (tRNA processing enzyme)